MNIVIIKKEGSLPYKSGEVREIFKKGKKGNTLIAPITSIHEKKY